MPSKKLIDVLDEMNLKEDKSRDMVINKLRRLSNLIFDKDRIGDGQPTGMSNPDLVFVSTIMEDLIESSHKRITRLEIEKCNRLYKQYNKEIK